MPRERCKDYDKANVKVTPFPVKLFHATTDVESVCKDGLKPAIEVKNTGLGGGTPRIISFTTSPEWATTIARDLQSAIRISNGEVDLSNICEYLDRQDATSQIKESPCKIWKQLESGKLMYLTSQY